VPDRTERERQEDAYIALLEGKLGWRKQGRKTTSYGAGLDDEGLDGVYADSAMEIPD
jgi:nucleolar MIF4G domain-containing protein 1